jgi:hypothetical protein
LNPQNSKIVHELIGIILLAALTEVYVVFLHFSKQMPEEYECFLLGPFQFEAHNFNFK